MSIWTDPPFASTLKSGGRGGTCFSQHPPLSRGSTAQVVRNIVHLQSPYAARTPFLSRPCRSFPRRPSRPPCGAPWCSRCASGFVCALFSLSLRCPFRRCPSRQSFPRPDKTSRAAVRATPFPAPTKLRAPVPGARRTLSVRRTGVEAPPFQGPKAAPRRNAFPIAPREPRSLAPRRVGGVGGGRRAQLGPN